MILRVPLHLWIVGAVSLLWHAGGAYDYVLVQLGDPSYLARMPPARVTQFQTAPVWFHASWALGVWFAVIGSLFLLLRSRFAVQAFWLSAAGAIISFVLSVSKAGLAGPASPSGMALALELASVVMIALLALYARRIRQRGVLR